MLSIALSWFLVLVPASGRRIARRSHRFDEVILHDRRGWQNISNAAQPKPAVKELDGKLNQALRTKGTQLHHVGTAKGTVLPTVNSTSPTWKANLLLCALPTEGSGAPNPDHCSNICQEAVQRVKQPWFPLDFFGGLTKTQRGKLKKGKIPNGKGVAELQLELEEANGVVKVNHVDESFAYPMHMQAYFTCYTRGKWPLFNAWVVDPALQGKGAVRVGSFGVPDRKSPNFKSYHATVPKEYLRSADVDGVWSDYFGFDQGHWAPDAPFRSKKELVQTTYYFVNVSPQTSCLNRGNWERLEAGVREMAVSKDDYISVMAGPLDRVPAIFHDSTEEQETWFELLEMWSAAGEVLLDDLDNGKKSPHWIEATSSSETNRHCILRGDETLRDATFREDHIGKEPVCDSRNIAKDLGDYSLFLMTQAGVAGVRRGVRVPLGYWKVASWKSGTDHMYCCWLFDQVNAVYAPTDCLQTVTEAGAPVLPPNLKEAPKSECEAFFTPSTKETVECNFAERGIGWRGKYLLKQEH